jgi:hypothetical protein
MSHTETFRDGEWTVLDSAQDADRYAAEIESIVEGWYSDGPIDWGGLYDRLDSESYLGPRTTPDDQIEGPFWKRVRSIARRAKRELDA